ncbi:MAG: hypothetical protein JWM35_1385 [Verrucomicrobia bacterium]|nr:hypothetical protein [Verrucomicrobiota bacterium]
MFFSLERKIVLAFGITLAALGIMVGGAWFSLTRFHSTFEWVDHTHKVLYELEALLNRIQGVQIESQRYLISGDPACLDRWTRNRGLAHESFERLSSLTADNPAQTERVRQMLPLIEQTETLTRERHELRQQAGGQAAMAEASRGRVRTVVDDLTTRVQAAENDERALLASRTAVAQRAATLTLTLTILSSLLAASLAGIGLFLAIRDLNARHKAEAELDRFFTLTHDLLCIADFSGHFTRLNPAWTETFGFATEELMAKPYLDFVHPDDRERTQAQAARQAQGLEATSFENRYLCKDGTYRWLQWNARPVVPDRVIFATARDVTDRKRVEQIHLQFRSLFESLPGLYLVLTPRFKIVAVSDAYVKSAMTTRAALLEQDLFEAFPDNPDDSAATGVVNLRASLERVLETGATDTMAVQKYDVRRPDGTYEERFWSPINSPVFGADRQVEYIIHRVEDVTDFVRQKTREGAVPDLQSRLNLMEAEIFKNSHQLQAANQQLQAVNGELEAFSYSVSHDLRAPLRHIDGFANLLTKHAAGSFDEKSRRYVEVISEAARKMGRLIDDLLSFSRMGRVQMKHSLVDQNDLVASVIRDGRFDRPERPIEWHIAPLPTVSGDAALLRQVWSNLIGNAVKYSGRVPAPRIEIGTQPAATPGEQVFFIRDNGAGFDMRYVEKLFGVFQRLHSEAEFEGTGIGLANVRRIVTRHRGRVWAEGSPEAGAVFYFSLPVPDHAPANS